MEGIPDIKIPSRVHPDTPSQSQHGFVREPRYVEPSIAREELLRLEALAEEEKRHTHRYLYPPVPRGRDLKSPGTTSDRRHGSPVHSPTDVNNSSSSRSIHYSSSSTSSSETERENNAFYRRDKTRFRAKAPDAGRTYVDPYGRTLKGEVPNDKEYEFQAILPDNPFGVIRKQPSGRKKHWSPKKFMPILQFWTWRTELHIMIRDADLKSATKSFNNGLCQCDIVDRNVDWCGSIVLETKWIRGREAQVFSFIAISEAKRFTDEECPVWTYYIPKEREESEWDLYYVLLLERNIEKGLWERVGLGKVFQAAFREKKWAEIKLG